MKWPYCLKVCVLQKTCICSTVAFKGRKEFVRTDQSWNDCNHNKSTIRINQNLYIWLKSGPSENSLADFCTFPLLNALKINLLSPKKKMVKLSEMWKSSSRIFKCSRLKSLKNSFQFCPFFMKMLKIAYLRLVF